MIIVSPVKTSHRAVRVKNFEHQFLSEITKVVKIYCVVTTFRYGGPSCSSLAQLVPLRKTFLNNVRRLKRRLKKKKKKKEEKKERNMTVNILSLGLCLTNLVLWETVCSF